MSQPTDLDNDHGASDGGAVYGGPVVNYLNAEAGIRSWLLTRDHKRIGIMFLVLTTFFFFVGGLFALLVRIELLTPGPTIMNAMTYNRMFTLHGVVMIFLFMIPAIPGVFGNFFLPIMMTRCTSPEMSRPCASFASAACW